MARGRGTASIVASPVLVGAVTTLVVIVSVFLAYGANKGLPFVPTYDLSARLPNGSNLVPGNEVRLGGFRIGVVDTIKPATQVINGKNTPIAQVNMKLDKTVEPLPVDTHVIVRSRPASRSRRSRRAARSRSRTPRYPSSSTTSSTPSTSRPARIRGSR
jgi:ABC-type transporter Mla subunit MlaD